MIADCMEALNITKILLLLWCEESLFHKLFKSCRTLNITLNHSGMDLAIADMKSVRK